MKIFTLPDLGEGLPDAEIVQWRVREGDRVALDGPLVSMETAKAVVDVPSPFSGRVVKLYGQAGDVIETGQPLAAFQLEADDEVTPPKEEPATVVGHMSSSDDLLEETVSQLAGVKVTPAVRALARKLRIDLASVVPSGSGGVVTRRDIQDAAAEPHESALTPPPALSLPAHGAWEPVRGTRRTMARAMSQSHQQVVPVTIMDDADVHHWSKGQDIMARLIRALVAAAAVEPALNAWYDGVQNRRLIHQGMDVGMAVDTPEGLFVAALRSVQDDSAEDLREKVNTLRENVRNRSIPPEDLKDYTIVLSNFGVFAGRYATPIVTPPCVAIIAAGKLRNELVLGAGGIEQHKTIPLSLSFDHRACTGGEAARFLQAMIQDLTLPD